MSTTFTRALSSYQHLLPNLPPPPLPSSLPSFLHYVLLDLPVVPVLLTCHSLSASLSIYSLTQGRQYWLKSLILTAFAAFGGSTLSNILSASPTPLFTVSSNYMVTYIVMCWYLINHIALLRYIFSFRVPRATLLFLATAAKARSIMSFIDDFVPRFPHASVGAVLLGGLAGSGGSLFVSVERIVQGGFGTASEFSRPGWGFKSAYWAAFVYYVATDPVGWVRDKLSMEKWGWDKDHVRLVVSLMLCLHTVIEVLFARTVNPFWLTESIMYKLSGVRREWMEDDEKGEEQMATPVGVRRRSKDEKKDL